MEIESQNQSSLTVKLTHASNSALSLAIGTILSFTVATASAQTTVNLTIEAAIPSGAIVAYNGACPTGWTEFSSGKGRVLVGLGSGNVDSLGDSLTTRTLASVGGLEYTTGVPASTVSTANSVPGPTFNLSLEGAGSGLYSSIATDTTLSGDKADSNMPPFVVVRYCEKN